jgi:peptide/nickel transport system substrate-binding protein
MWFEKLIEDDWTVDPSVWNYQINFRPDQYCAGQLASSWEFTSPGVFVIHLRQNIYWQNLPPVNGRQFVASDVIYHYDRLYGMGDGFTTPSPYLPGDPVMSSMTSITATDKYTVVFKFSVTNPEAILESMEAEAGDDIHDEEAPEAVALWGNLLDWHHAMGTGPFILTDFVDGTSATLVKNPNYWGHDERYPQNQLPYVDRVEYLIIANNPTTLAAVRTGKISILDSQTLDTALQMQKSNPDILQVAEPVPQADTIEPRDDLKPFNDINVRKALQMAINLPELASTYYDGTCSPDPSTLTSNYMTGWGWSYSQWPASLQAEYAYNPTQAKQLLATAGYPNGFTTDIVADSAGDLTLLQAILAEFSAIGVTVNIRLMDNPDWISYVLLGHKQDALATEMGSGGWLGYTYEPVDQFNPFVTGFFANYEMASDPKIDADATAALNATSVDQMKAALTDANKEVAQQHFIISLLQPNTYAFCQKWIKGYNGQTGSLRASGGPNGFYQARFWIDQSLEQ